MDNAPSDSTIDALVNAAKLAGATHCEVATVIGHPNFVVQTQRWCDKIHTAGMNVTFRCADIDMEGLYGHAKAVGPARLTEEHYLSQLEQVINNNPNFFKDGDEWAVYPERTEGIFQDATSWIWPNDPGTYATFFKSLADRCAAAFVAIGKKVVTGLSTNNGSEILSGWMDAGLINHVGYICVDHYVDNNSAQLEADLRMMAAKYNKPIYLQETAPDRFNVPSQAEVTSYFASLARLIADGILVKMGYWGFWSGTPEAGINADFSLTLVGQTLQTLYGVLPPAPTPAPTPAPPVPVSGIISNAEFVHKVGTKEYGFYLPALSEGAIKDKAMNLGKNILNADGTINFPAAKEVSGL